MSLSPFVWPPDTRVMIPAYRAEQPLRRLLPELLSVVAAKRVFVVDDGSQDGTAALCAGLGVECIAHVSNRGKGAALRTGFDALDPVRTRWVVSMDADGQHSPEDLPTLVAAAREGPFPCLWIGRRKRTPGVMPLARVLSNAMTSWGLSLLSGRSVEDSQCGYRVYPLQAVQSLPLRFERFELESEVILRLAHAGCPVKSVPIRTVYSGAPSHISHLADTLRWIRAVLSVWWELRIR